jgi:hypothetical protein
MALSRTARRALAWLPASPEDKALAGPNRPLRGTMAGLRRRGLAVPVDAAGKAWRRTAAGDLRAAEG